jgi:hypothetical protein
MSFRGLGQFSWDVRCHVFFKVLTRILQIYDAPSHFQESSVWNYFEFLFEDMGHTCALTWTSVDTSLQMSMIIRNCHPLLKHMLEFSLKIFYGGLCHLWLHIFNKIKVYWNVWVFDYFHFVDWFCLYMYIYMHIACI